MTLVTIVQDCSLTFLRKHWQHEWSERGSRHKWFQEAKNEKETLKICENISKLSGSISRPGIFRYIIRPKILMSATLRSPKSMVSEVVCSIQKSEQNTRTVWKSDVFLTKRFQWKRNVVIEYFNNYSKVSIILITFDNNHLQLIAMIFQWSATSTRIFIRS